MHFMQLHYIEFDIGGLLTNLLRSAPSLVLVKAFQFSKLKKQHLVKMVGEGGGEIDFLGGNRTLEFLCCEKWRKKKLIAIHIGKRDCSRRGSTCVPLDLQSDVLLVAPLKHPWIARNPLGLNSEVRIFLCSILLIQVKLNKNEEKCWFLEKSSLNWVFFDTYQL